MAPASSTVAGRLWRLAPLALLVAVLAGCGVVRFHAQTNEIYQPGPGITVRNGDVYGLNLAVVTDGEGHGTLIGALLNKVTAPDKLEAVSVRQLDGKRLTVAILPGYIALQPEQSVQLADTAAVRVTGDLTSGTYVRLVLTFHNAAPIRLKVPVLISGPDFNSVTIGPAPTPTVPTHSP